MRGTVLIAALAALAACNERAADRAAEAPDAAAAATPTAAAEIMAADGKSPVGRYRVTTAEGEEFMEELKADGTYVQTKDGAVTETGRWEQKSPSTYCYTTDEEGATQQCNTEQVDENGVWTTVNPDGETATVVRVET